MRIGIRNVKERTRLETPPCSKSYSLMRLLLNFLLDGRPVQVIRPELNLSLLRHDVSELPEDEREPEVLRLATAAAQQPFDLSSEALLRAFRDSRPLVQSLKTTRT
jgi:hypothetical protein